MKPYLYFFALSIIFIGCQKSTIVKKHLPVDTTTTIIKPDTGWQAIADIPGGPRTNATGFTLNNKGYICSGVNQFAGNLIAGYDDMYCYDPETDSWAPKSGPLPIDQYFPNEGRRDLFSFVIDGKAYAGGGISVMGEGGGDVQQYDEAGDKWTLKATKTRESITDSYTFDFSAAVSNNNLGYIFSYSAGAFGIWVYDNTTNKLTYSALNYDIFDGSEYNWLASNGDDLYFDGMGDSFVEINTKTGKFNPNLLSSPTVHPPDTSVSLNSVVYKNSVYMSFGDEGHLYRYSLAKSTWQELSEQTLGITEGVSWFMIGSKLYFVGGNNGLFTASTSKAWVIDLDAYPED